MAPSLLSIICISAADRSSISLSIFCIMFDLWYLSIVPDSSISQPRAIVYPAMIHCMGTGSRGNSGAFRDFPLPVANWAINKVMQSVWWSKRFYGNVFTRCFKGFYLWANWTRWGRGLMSFPNENRFSNRSESCRTPGRSSQRFDFGGFGNQFNCIGFHVGQLEPLDLSSAKLAVKHLTLRINRLFRNAARVTYVFVTIDFS